MGNLAIPAGGSLIAIRNAHASGVVASVSAVLYARMSWMEYGSDRSFSTLAKREHTR